MDKKFFIRDPISKNNEQLYIYNVRKPSSFHSTSCLCLIDSWVISYSSLQNSYKNTKNSNSKVKIYNGVAENNRGHKKSAKTRETKTRQFAQQKIRKNMYEIGLPYLSVYGHLSSDEDPFKFFKASQGEYASNLIFTK
jgi:hypothetical protein